MNTKASHDTLESSLYCPVLSERTRVRLVKSGHPENTHPASVLVALPNPSRRAENQWYDIRFDNGVYGRFQGRYLERIPDVEIAQESACPKQPSKGDLR